MLDALDAFVTAAPLGGRHEARVAQIAAVERGGRSDDATVTTVTAEVTPR